MAGTPLIIGEAQKAALRELRDNAAANPIDMPPLMKRLETPEGKAAHMRQMNCQTIDVPLAFMVTFSIETNHPCGTCRHMSMSATRRGRTPTPEAVWMVAEELGFVGSMEACVVWPEDLQRGPQQRTDRAIAINVVQPLSVFATTTSA
jgi:hypothetical protein